MTDRLACGIRRLAVLGLLTAPLFSASEVQAQQCVKWSNQLDHATVLADGASSSSTIGQELYFRRRLLRDTPNDACTVYWRETRKKLPSMYWGPAPVSTTTCGISAAVPRQTDRRTCYPDFNCNGVANSVDINSGYGFTIWRVTPELDPCCSRIPNGPYTDLEIENPNLFAFEPEAGKPFSWETKDLVLEENNDRAVFLHNLGATDFRSDARDLLLGIPLPPNTVAEELILFSLWNDLGALDRYDTAGDPDYYVPPPPQYQTDPAHRASIDHIIPRLDSHGCACGDNSVRNAQVISVRLNSSMQNACGELADPALVLPNGDTGDPRRQAIVDAYTLAP